MSNKTVDAFVKELVNSDQELYTWPADFSHVQEQYCAEEEPDQAESEEE